MLFKLTTLLVLVCIVYARNSNGNASGRNILVFGGNGFIGGETVVRFIDNNDKVTIVNRKNWYWDSNQRIKPYVTSISCDRKNGLDSCDELVDLIKDTNFDSVLDFSAQNADDIKKTMNLLQGKVHLYVLASSDRIYEVCEKNYTGVDFETIRIKESDAVRPKDEQERARLAEHYVSANKKMEVEEALIEQRNQDDGIPFVIFRIPDTIGARDTTYRFWVYQIIIKLQALKPELNYINIPKSLENYDLSFAFVKDVADAIYGVTQKRTDPNVIDQVFNLANNELITLPQMLRDMQEELGLEPVDYPIVDRASRASFFLYPHGRSGPLDISKAKEFLEWNPTSWKQAVRQTAEYYEELMREGTLPIQRDEIIQLAAQHVARGDDVKTNDFYDMLENAYNINISHFKHTRDEL